MGTEEKKEPSGRVKENCKLCGKIHWIHYLYETTDLICRQCRFEIYERFLRDREDINKRGYLRLKPQAALKIRSGK